MIGAIVGDIVGSRFEWKNLKSKDFEMFSKDCHFTDDTVMTLAIANALTESVKDNFLNLSDCAIKNIIKFFKLYPTCGFGSMFKQWVISKNHLPYNSFGNGSAMRISSVAYVAKSLCEVKKLAKQVTEITHNHPEGLKGAECLACCIWLAKNKKSKTEIKQFVEDNYYILNFTLNDIRPSYTFDVSCQGSVPQSIVAFLESDSFEDAIRNAVSIDGDSDTIAAMCGSIAEAYYKIDQKLREQTVKYLDDFLISVLNKFEAN